MNLTPLEYKQLVDTYGNPVAAKIQALFNTFNSIVGNGAIETLDIASPSPSTTIDLANNADASVIILNSLNASPTLEVISVEQFDNFPDHPIIFWIQGNATFEFVDKSVSGANIKLEATPTSCSGNNFDLIAFEKRSDGNIYVTNVRNYIP
jgi:hypothetical protein